MDKQNHPETLSKTDKIKQRWKDGAYAKLFTPEVKEKRKATIRKARTEGRFLTPAERFNETKDPKYAHVGKGVKHHRAKKWKLKSPTGKILEGTNLNEIVRNNLGLFEPDDVVWGGPSKNQCRAVSGISNLRLLKPDGSYRRTHWKGWQLLSCTDVNP